MAEFKRFILFASEQYYPAGGMDDAVGSFDTIEEAKQTALMEHATAYIHVLDCEERRLVVGDVTKLDQVLGGQVE